MSQQPLKPQGEILLLQTALGEISATRNGAIFIIRFNSLYTGEGQIKLLQTQAIRLAEWILKEVGK